MIINTAILFYIDYLFGKLHNNLLRDLISNFKFCLVASSPVNPTISELIFYKDTRKGNEKTETNNELKVKLITRGIHSMLFKVKIKVYINF